MEGALSFRGLKDALAPPRPHELFILATEATLLLLIRFVGGIQFPLGLSLLTWAVSIPVLFLYLLGGGLLRTALAGVGGGASGALRYARRWLELRRLADLLRLVLGVVLVAHAYTWLKIFVPILNPRLFDDWFYAADNTIFLGVNPNRLVLALFSSPGARRFFDWQYTLYLPSLLAGVSWYMSSLSLVERRRFVAAFTALWLGSAWIYLAVPALGPCYTLAEDYVEAHRDMPLQKSTQDALIRQYGGVRATKRRGASPYLNPAFGVAAMPSLHVAAQVLLAIWSRGRSRVLALGFGLMAVVTFLGSLVSGWHYAVDGYAGALLAVGSAWLGHHLPVAPVWPRRRPNMRPARIG